MKRYGWPLLFKVGDRVQLTDAGIRRAYEACGCGDWREHQKDTGNVLSANRTEVFVAWSMGYRAKHGVDELQAAKLP